MKETENIEWATVCIPLDLKAKLVAKKEFKTEPVWHVIEHLLNYHDDRPTTFLVPSKPRKPARRSKQ